MNMKVLVSGIFFQFAIVTCDGSVAMTDIVELSMAV